MKKVTVEGGPLNVNSGRVLLNGEQARRRRASLEPVKGNKIADDGAGLYEVKAPIQFKVGESFGFDGQVGKNGVAFDPEAERQARIEAEKAEKGLEGRLRVEIAQEFQRRFEQELAKQTELLEARLAEQVEAMRGELEINVRAELEPKIRAELEPKIRAELAGAGNKGGK